MIKGRVIAKYATAGALTTLYGLALNHARKNKLPQTPDVPKMAVVVAVIVSATWTIAVL